MIKSNSFKDKYVYVIVVDSLLTYDNNNWQDDLGEEQDDRIEIMGKVVKEDEIYIWVISMLAPYGDFKNAVRIYKNCILHIEEVNVKQTIVRKEK